uniref:NLR family CARD domain-containing protein 4 n=1 Tax=Latimeria chalumnae TaxID=7897 RepID=H3AX88_LATCH
VSFIKSKRSELIQRMTKTTIRQIVDELFEEDVLNSEEMDRIMCKPLSQDACRLLLEEVLKKGSKACDLFHQFLKKHNSYLFEDLQETSIFLSVTKQNLDSLTEDLKDLYLSSCFQKFHPLGGDIDIIFDLDTTFTDTVLLKKNINNCKLGELNLHTLLDELKNPCIIEGEAGKGKSTLLKRIAALWASGNCPALTKFRLVFFLSLSSVRRGLYETICEQLLREPYSMKKATFMEALWDLKQDVLFLLDGYDEFMPQASLEIDDLIRKNHKYKNVVIVSTRTESVRRIRQFGSLIIEVGDLSEASACSLIKNVLDCDMAQSLLLQLDESSTMKELMKTPLFAVIACAIRMGESNFIPNTQTALFSTLYDLMVDKNKYKTKNVAASHITQSINRCGDLALDGIFDHRLNFQEEDLLDVKEEVLLAAGLLNKYTAQRLKPVYRFFHKSFQEYTAGRRLKELLTSKSKAEVTRAHQYMQKIDTVSKITNEYRNLLLYTCGSSIEATGIIIKHIAGVYKHDSLKEFSLIESRQSIPSIEGDLSKNLENSECGETPKATNLDCLVECSISFFYESSSKSILSKEFEEFFNNKSLYINTLSIPTYLFDFFKYLPNCLSALDLIKLDLFGNPPPSVCEGVDELSGQNENHMACKTYIPEKAVSLFFDWSQVLNTLEVTLANFQKLNKKDIKYLGKICCAASSLRLHVSKSAGITGELQNVLETCKNMQELIVKATPLTLQDEQQIVMMEGLKTLYISNLQTERLQGGFVDGMCNLVNIEQLTLDNVRMTEADAKKLVPAENIVYLKKLTLLHLSRLITIGEGMSDIVEAASREASVLEEIKLINCCLTDSALKILAQNLCNIQELKVLDLSENNLAEEANDSLTRLVDNITALTKLTTLMLPCGSDVGYCLPRLSAQLEHMPVLTKLGLENWGLTDADIGILTTMMEKENMKGLQYLNLAKNSVSSEGWLSLFKALRELKELKYIDFSSKEELQPNPELIKELGHLICNLPLLLEVRMLKWQLDEHDLRAINNNMKTSSK